MSSVHTIGVLDRTGELAPLVEELSARLDGQLVLNVVDHRCAIPSDLKLAFLVLGPREGSSAVLRRVQQYLDANPATLAIACGIPAAMADKRDLNATGVRHISRAKPSMVHLVRLMKEAMAELGIVAQAALDVVDSASGASEETVLNETGVTQAGLDDVAEAGVARTERDIRILPRHQAGDQAHLVTIASATGGCGKTFFATNLAMLAASEGKRVLLVDLDLQFGEVAIALRVTHPYSVYDGLYDAHGNRLPENALADHLPELTFHHKLGFDVLTAPKDPTFSDYVGARDASEILDVVLPLYDVVIVDTPPSLNDVVLVALDRSDVVAVMATLDVPSLKNLSIFLDTLNRLQISDVNVKLVLNKAENDVGMKVSQAQEAFNNRFIAAIPLSRAVSRSINAGTVVTATEPRSQVSRKTKLAAAGMLPDMISPDVPSSVPWWRRWISKKSDVTSLPKRPLVKGQVS